MTYNKKNRLKRIVAIQEITLEHTNRGVTQQYVYKNVIKPKYCISQSAFYNYLSTPAKKQLKEMEEKERYAKG